MRIVIAGAMGHIGQHLVEQLSAKHEVVGVVRTVPSMSASRSAVRYVASGDRDALRACLQTADVVIHVALAGSGWNERLVRRNTALTKELLELSRGGTARLVVYFSSWVVYSGVSPDESGYREEQSLETVKKLDPYTRLKIEDERQVRAFCGDAGIGYLILRPTVVVGLGLFRPLRAPRWIPVHISGRTVNLIHVSDVCATVERLLDLGISNEVFNLGGDELPSEEFFAALRGGRSSILPSPLERLSRWFPSTLWFLKQDVRMNSDRVRAVTGITPSRAQEEYFAPDLLTDVRVSSLDSMKEVTESGAPFKAYGAGYSLSLNPLRRVEREQRAVVAPYRGIVALNGDRVTVRAGTSLADVTRFLDQVDLTLATLPEFVGATAGACFFVDIHGSSNEYFSMLELILEVKYLDERGETRTATRGDPEWDALRQRDSQFFLTEVTFQCERAGYLTKRVEFLDDALLSQYITEDHRKNLSTVIQWFPHYRRMMVHHINRSDVQPEHPTAPRSTFRAAPYPTVRTVYGALLRGKKVQYGRHADILGTWKRMSREGYPRSFPRRKPLLFDTELCVTLEDAARLVDEVRRRRQDADSPFDWRDSIGVRFAYQTQADGSKQGYVWIEQPSRYLDKVERFAELVTTVARERVRFHQGKYVPPRFVGR